MEWFFPEKQPAQTEQEVTQRDQFKDDDLALSEAIVREAIQNSMDAASNPGDKVTVRFAHLNSDSEIDSAFLQSILSSQLEHAEASGIDTSEIDFSHPDVLIIEDFGTKGLTGSTEEWDKENFTDFFRRHGKSHKTGLSGGRWGLGKLVFSLSSKASCFFGITIREGEETPLLMGQAVLNYHTIGDSTFPPHGHFCELKAPNTPKAIQIPGKDTPIVGQLIQNFKLKRKKLPGLSIAIPFPKNEINPEAMIGPALINYFFPILTNSVVLEFDDITVDASTLRGLASKHIDNKIPERDKLFDFIDSVKNFNESDLVLAKAGWTKNGKVNESSFSETDLKTLKEAMNNNQIVSVRFPITIRLKDGSEKASHFDVHIQSPQNINTGLDLYVRGGITVPLEKKFKDRKAFGVLWAKHEAVVDFLGDAENPAHTKWSGQAEKLKKYVAADKTLRAIRNSACELHDLLVETAEQEEKDALTQFFWAPESKSPKPGETPDPPPPTPPNPKPKAIKIGSISNGFSVKPGNGIDSTMIPFDCTLRAAYDMMDKNPLKNYDPLDFNFNDKEKISIECNNSTITARDLNTIKFTVDSTDFSIEVTGFDSERDVVAFVETGDI